MKKGCLTAVLLGAVLAVAIVLVGPRLVEAGMRFLYPRSYGQLIEREAAEFQLDPYLVYAVVKTESGFDPQACSHADARGLMQLTQETFDWIASLYPPEDGGGDIFDPAICTVAVLCCDCCWINTVRWTWPWRPIMPVWAT